MSYVGREKVFNSSKTYSNKSFKTNQDSHQTCTHCKQSNQELLHQITALKDKAHQSFMQVLQIQQLHDEEILQLREEDIEKETKSMADIQKLQRQVLRLRGDIAVLQRNAKRHNYDMGQRELVIQNIDAIICQDGQNSYLDESELMQFKEIVNVRNGSDYVATLRKEIYKDFKFISNNKTQIQKLFILIKQLKDQNHFLLNKNQLLTKSLADVDGKFKQLKMQMDNLVKQQKFMSEHIKRLGSDKLKLQKKLTQSQKTRQGEERSLVRTQNLHLSSQNLRPVKSFSPNVMKDYQQIDRNMLSSVLQLSKLTESDLFVTQREINELNYAKFMTTEEGSQVQTNFHRKKSK